MNSIESICKTERAAFNNRAALLHINVLKKDILKDNICINKDESVSIDVKPSTHFEEVDMYAEENWRGLNPPTKKIKEVANASRKEENI